MKELNWDNDLSNSIEDFLKIKKGNFLGIFNLNDLSQEIKNILRKSYYNEQHFLDYITYIPCINQKTNIDKIFEFINNSSKNSILNDNFNIIGINGEISNENSSKLT